MKVYRLETKDGQGAFWKHTQAIRALLKFYGRDNFPTYFFDTELQDSCRKIGCDPSINDVGFDAPKPKSDWRYGFPNLRRLHIYFPPRVIQRLEEKTDIRLKAYEVPGEYVAKSKYQVIFNIKHAKEIPVTPR